MSEPINDGGPAFPIPSGPEPRINEFHDRWEGMSLRDWFAGQALIGLLAVEPSDCIAEQFAENAYEMADAMLVEREKRKT